MLVRFPAALLCLTFATGSFAFDKDVHETITLQIVEQYNQCQRHLGYEEITDRDAREMATFVSLEDESPLLDRAMNWHFYDAHRGTSAAMPNLYFLIKVHLHDIYDTRVKNLFTAISNNDDGGIIENTGRVIHYIEDMAVPAHVAPIYHAAPDKSSFIQKLVVKDEPDAFDSMPKRHDAKQNFNISDSVCEQLGQSNRSLQTIMESLAEDTIGNVQSKIPTSTVALESETFEEIFWTIRKPDTAAGKYKGFSSYPVDDSGTVDANRRFNPDDDVCKRGQLNICLDFFEKQYQAMTLAVVEALMVIDTRRRNQGETD